MKVPTDGTVKPENLEAKVIPEAPEKEVADKKPAAIPNTDKAPKGAETPAKKPKATDPKKTNEKKLNEPGKLTAILERRLFRRRLIRDDKTKVET
jgi:hypothetical protein